MAGTLCGNFAVSLNLENRESLPRQIFLCLPYSMTEGVRLFCFYGDRYRLVRSLTCSAGKLKRTAFRADKFRKVCTRYCYSDGVYL